MTSERVRVKRVYEAAARGDGARLLVDRLWPRGLRKEDADFEWHKELAPSTELRRFYGHVPERFDEFAKRYRDELRAADAADALAHVRSLARRRPVTLLTATKDVDHSGAAVLADVVRGRRR
ncbi:MAG TPA: DUF488 family protein [Acidimicrobiia bacterium]|nr:DUF488 family protein [Acidimicrobiia bacterium]